MSDFDTFLTFANKIHKKYKGCVWCYAVYETLYKEVEEYLTQFVKDNPNHEWCISYKMYANNKKYDSIHFERLKEIPITLDYIILNKENGDLTSLSFCCELLEEYLDIYERVNTSSNSEFKSIQEYQYSKKEQQKDEQVSLCTK